MKFVKEVEKRVLRIGCMIRLQLGCLQRTCAMLHVIADVSESKMTPLPYRGRICFRFRQRIQEYHEYVLM